MKKTYKYIALAALALGFAACTQDDDFAPQQEDIVQIASANIATEIQTRVNTLEGGALWENDDWILLVNNSRDNKNSGTYTYSGTDWSLTEGLVLYASGTNATNDFTAYYPAASDEDYILPTDQSTVEGIKQADRMVATTNGVAKGAAVALSFERRNAMITIVPVMTEQFTGKSVSSLQIEDVTNPYHPADTEGYTAIIESSETGFEVKVKVVDSDELLTATTSTAIEAGKHYTFNLKVGKDLMEMEMVSVAQWTQLGIGEGNAEEVPPYITFTASDAQTFILKKDGSPTAVTFEYQVNWGTWKQVTVDQAIAFGGAAGELRLRAISPEGTGWHFQHRYYFTFGNDVPVACSGDIRTLVDWKNYDKADTKKASFHSLFHNCAVLTTPPELPATELRSHCYTNMFYNCSSLTTAPKLPATELADSCYLQMFCRCTSLTTAPELPATKLGRYCYQFIFDNCSSLTTAPAILPATELAEGCYLGMFQECPALTVAPILPAPTLVRKCYLQMFLNCVSLKSITMLATNIDAYNCFYLWCYGVPSGGTFYKNSEATWELPFNRDGIPGGWTVENYTAPEK